MLSQLYKTVSLEELAIVRCNFINTHRLKAGFDFSRYFINAMHDNFVHVLGRSLYWQPVRHTL